MWLREYMSEAAKELSDRLYSVDVDLASLRKDLETGKYTADDVNYAAFDYVDDCVSQLAELPDCDDILSGETVPGLPSSHLTETLELLLDFGLDPNWIFQHDGELNIMVELQLIDNGYQGADSLYLLLSHGGDPNLVVDGERLVSEPYFDLWFDTCNRDMLYDALYAAKIHYCMVLIGFGAKLEDNDNELLERVDDFDLSLLRNHRDYYVGAIHSDKSLELCFFDRHTNWEVARFWTKRVDEKDQRKCCNKRMEL